MAVAVCVSALIIASLRLAPHRDVDQRCAQLWIHAKYIYANGIYANHSDLLVIQGIFFIAPVTTQSASQRALH